VEPDAIGVTIRTLEVMNISPRRPKRLFRGSETSDISGDFKHVSSVLTLSTGKSSGDVWSRVNKINLPFVICKTWLIEGCVNAKFSGER